MILVADFGGTTIKLGLVQDTQIIAKTRLDALANHPMQDRLEVVAKSWESLLQEQSRSLKDCIGVALALPFIVDVRNSRVCGEFGKFPGASEIDFSEWSQSRLGLPLVMENDLRLALLGESVVGSAKDNEHVVMLAIGTGIGCAVISGGRLFHGANNRAASLLGHSCIAYNGSVGRCGNIGCAEDLASTATLGELAKSHPDFTESSLSRAARIDYETVFALAEVGDVCSLGVRDQSLTIWATLVQNAVLAYDPELVVLGGGVLKSQEIILPAIREHLRRYMPCIPWEIPIVAATLGDDAALIGGEALFRQIHLKQ
jgi:glucokinase